MLAELALLLASCDVNGAALGSCASQCPRATGASYTICAEAGKTKNIVTPGKPKPVIERKPKPMRLCSYYVNGTTNIPTSSVISAWVEIGTRACIGDPEPQVSAPKPSSRTVEEVVVQAFTANAVRPFAYLQSSGEIEVEQAAGFAVIPGGGEHVGQLFGSAATIRFVPIEIKWTFSDGQRLSGQFVSASFEQPDLISALAEVSYRIDYKNVGGSWVYGAAFASLVSNQVEFSVVDPPRRTLLVG